jgi:hypothetical protein
VIAGPSNDLSKRPVGLNQSGKVIKQVSAEVRYGIDVCDRALAVARRTNNGVKFRHLDLMRVLRNSKTLPDVQCVIGLDIIEHFTKEDAVLLLVTCEGVASKCVMFFIPVGNHPQACDDRGFENHYYQTHRSKWYPDEMERLGYDVWFYPNWHKKVKPPKEKGAMWCVKMLE